MKFCYNTTFTLPKQDLDPSYKMDLDLWDCFGRKKLCLITEEIWYSKFAKDCFNIKHIQKKFENVTNYRDL